jgi:hypothetical protein
MKLNTIPLRATESSISLLAHHSDVRSLLFAANIDCHGAMMLLWAQDSLFTSVLFEL